MKKFYFIAFTSGALILLAGCQAVQAQSSQVTRDNKSKTIIYFNPEVFPHLDEIKEPTHSAFFSAVSDRVGKTKKYNMLRVNADLMFDSVTVAAVQEYCANNNAHFAVVPKVKYFKVGIGKYVFSNQVIVSLKLYDASGNMLAQSDYDTYRKNARLLGSAENSIKIGTLGAMKLIGKNLRQAKSTELLFSEN